MIIDALGQGLQAAGALGDGHPTPFLESCLGRGYGSVDVFFRRFGNVTQLLPVRRIDRFEGFAAGALLPLTANIKSLR